MPVAASTTPTASALSAAYARLAETYPGPAVTEPGAGDADPGGDGWVPAATLADGADGLDAFLAWDESQTLRDYGHRARPDVVASFGLHRYAWPACLLITVPWFLHRRVPRLPVTHVSYDRTADRMALRPVSFACLPGDPAAALSGAVVVPDDEALRAQVRAAVAEHPEPVLGAFGPRMRRRGRALWGMATDELVEGLWYVAHLPRRGGAGRARSGAAAFRVLTGPDGEALPTRGRASCCMFYTLRPQDTCPHTRDADRIAKPTAATAV
ncbi:(2Fe-2S)-binding protein [Streptomyces sp. HUAS TT20]|uniref:(2Fe-2S)-binding protein n=1 Tax=Streptomyces sp. HUAS TT20 TaxID=3447509 RepID=UPI0021D882A5|nr:iron-sulfur protein [Streptomyces sp. HUAS 15-9]UXY30741.1 iron-sulfur protein [Streptomyces sp. HUAS 15-9]